CSARRSQDGLPHYGFPVTEERVSGAYGLVLVVEDEPTIAELQRRYLNREGYGVHVEVNGTAGLSAVRRLRPVAVVLDVGLPGLDGIEVCRRLRASGDWTPVIFVTARDDEVDRVLGLEIGGDDYLTKPFSPRELVARVKAVLRRGSGPGPAVLAAGPVRLDPAGRRVTRDGEPVALTTTEFNLLEALLRGRGRVVGRAELMADAWGQADYGASRTVDVHVAQLRAKLGDGCPIETVRGVGYRVAR
ncbi:MAG: response regulator transcription factor, partial [Marmoricola sp.]